MKEIKITKGYVTQVSDEDYDELKKYKWFADVRPCTVYARRTKSINEENQKKIFIHRQILKVKLGEYTDHIDGNGLNNTRENLRIVTSCQNNRNRKKIPGRSSKYKGVSFEKDRNKWRSIIINNYQKIDLGRFDNEVDAAKAYNKAAIELFGEFARLNDLGLQINENV